MGSNNKSRRAYPAEFRQQLVELYHAGRTSPELAQEFGPNAQSIRNWVAWAKRDADAAENPGNGGLTPSEREELNRLRRENRQLKLDREILSKAAAWFARETNRIPPQDSNS
jgi:transposase